MMCIVQHCVFIFVVLVLTSTPSASGNPSSRGFFLDPLPMPPPSTEPSPGAYLCEIRVHFLPTGLKVPHSDRSSPLVSGFVLRYSDGTITKTGNLRGTTCPGSLILMLGEHIVGVKEHSGWNGDITNLTFYAKDENEFNRKFEISCKEVMNWEHDSTPSDKCSVRSGGNNIVHSLSWCSEKNCLNGHTTCPKPRCPNPRFDNNAEPGRIAGFSKYPYENGEEVDYSFAKYEGEAYISSNLVPAHVWREIDALNLNKSEKDDLLLIEDEFSDRYDEVINNGIHAMECSSESHNICMLVQMVTKTNESAKKERYRKQLKKQCKALKRRVHLICDQMGKQLNVNDFCKRYDACIGSHKQTNKNAREKMADILEQHDLANERSLRVCSLCPEMKIFDPRHVPMWQRCVHPGCCSEQVPCCGEHVSFCDLCYDPVCHNHSEVHKSLCLKTLSRRCGWRGYKDDGEATSLDEDDGESNSMDEDDLEGNSLDEDDSGGNSLDEDDSEANSLDKDDGGMKSLDTRCCGKNLENSNKAERGKKCSKCGVLCCNECFISCKGWYRECRLTHMDCPESKVWCRKCTKEQMFWKEIKCEGCCDREEYDSDSEDSDHEEEESREGSDEEFEYDSEEDEE